MKDNTPEELYQAIEYLLNVAEQHNTSIVGFAWRSDNNPFIARIANIAPQEFSQALNMCDKIANMKIAQGKDIKRLRKGVV